MSTQRFPEGAVVTTGRCDAPLHDGDREPVDVVAMRFGRVDDPNPTKVLAWTACAECLADFAVADVDGRAAFVLGVDGTWHQVKGTLHG